jgi:SAM-dependent methyltransferase
MQLPQFHIHAQVEDHHWWFLARRSIVRSVLHVLVPPTQEKIVLDVGCGTGGNTAAFSNEYLCKGIDPVQEAIQFAKERYPSASYFCGYAPQDNPDDVAAAAAVLLMDVLEHVEDDFQLVSSLLACMKPGAYLVIMAPADPNLWSAHDKGFEHYRRYTIDRLRLLWKDLPVQERLVSYMNARLYPLVRLARLRKKALGPNDTDLRLPFAPINLLFRWMFEGEKKRLLQVLRGESNAVYKKGVSVFAVVQRKEGNINSRTYPSDVLVDERPWMEL